MEYILQLERTRQIQTLIWSIIFVSFFVLFSCYLMGIKGYILTIGLLFFLLMTPLLYGRFKLFLFLWIFVSPIVELQHFIQIGNHLNPFTYFITGLSFPFAMVLFFYKTPEVTKALPFVKYIIMFQIIVLLNIFRPETYLFSVFDVFKFHFIELFIIFCAYYYFKKNSPDTIFNWITIFILLNSLAAIFQKVTHIGMVIAEGIPRVAGLSAFSGTCGLLSNIYFPLGLYLFMNAETKKKKYFLGFVLFLNFLTLLITFTKSAYLTFFIIVFIILSVFSPKVRNQLVIVFLALSALVLFINFAFGLNLEEHILSRFTNNSSLSWRFKTWNTILSNITPLTVFVGNGVDSVRYLMFKITKAPSMAHNVYLQLIFEYGIFGLSYMVSLFYIFVKFIKQIIIEKKANLVFNITPVLILVAIFLSALSNNSTLIRTPTYFAWIILVAFYLQLKKEPNANSQS